MQDSERVISNKQRSRYSNRVLVGNWVEERSNYKKPKHRLSSTYQSEFTPKKSSSFYADFVLDKVINAQGTPLVSGLSTADNFSTVYDLSYNHFPNWMGKPIARKFRPKLGTHDPKDEYLNNYGNLTNYGLVQYKKEGWKCDIDDPRLTLKTHTQDNFIPPDKQSYKFKRFNTFSDLRCKQQEQPLFRCSSITPCHDPEKTTRKCVNVKK